MITRAGVQAMMGANPHFTSAYVFGNQSRAIRMAVPDHIQWLLEGRDKWNMRRRENDFTPDFSGADLYQAFDGAGELSSDGEIPLASFDLRRANFANSRLNTPFSTAGVNLRKANLRSAEFRAAQLPNAKLDGADLRNAGLADADLLQASLRDCLLTTAGLAGTNLWHADLTGADLRSAYLEGASLSLATLTNADFTNAVLTGADLSYSRPWTAKLFPPEDAALAPSDTPGERDISSISELLQQCTRLRENALPNRVFYFRGESHDGWKLEPSVMRSQDGIAALRAHEGEMLLELMSQRPEDFVAARSALAQWVLAQHHGLKTRLLDVTRNPLVALLGACGGLGSEVEEEPGNGLVHVFSVPRQFIKPFTSDTVAVIANIAKLSRLDQDCLLGWTLEESEKRLPGIPSEHPHYDDGMRLNGEVMRRLYHLIRQERPHFMERIDPRDYFRVFVVEPLQSFERIRAQAGAFLISAFHERFERDEVLRWNPHIPLYDHTVLDVPNKSKELLVSELGLLGITRENLLPGLDEAANAVARRYSSMYRLAPPGEEPSKSGSAS